MLARQGAGHGALAEATLGFTTGLELWLKADAGTSSVVDNTAISQWDDQSGNANNAVQGTGANQPLYQAGEQNGLPGIQFDGTNDFMSIAGITGNDASRTVFVVAKATAVGNMRCWCLGGSGSASIRAVDAVNWDYSLNQASGLVNLGGGPQTTDIVVIKYTSTASADGYVNGGSATNFDPADAYQATAAATTIGAQTAAATPFTGFIYEFLIYNSALNDTDRATVRDYLNAKWAVF